MQVVVERPERRLFGGRQARHVAAAVVLGFVAGAVCGWNLTFAVVLALGLWINTPLAVFVGSAGCGYVLAACAGGLVRAVGVFLLDKLAIGSALYTFAPGPTAALFGLDDYVVAGSLASALIAALPAAHVLCRVLCRRPPGPADAAALAPSARPDPFVRRGGALPAIGCLVAATVVLQVFGPQFVVREMLARLSLALGGPASVDRFDYDLWRGELELTNLRIRDPNHTGHVVLTISRVEARLDPGLLLRGRLHADEFALGGISVDTATGEPTAPIGVYARRPTMLKEGIPGEPVEPDPTRELELQGSLRHVTQVGRRLEAFGRIVRAVEFVADLEAPHSESGKRLQSATERRYAPHDAASGRPAPLVRLKQVRVEGAGDFPELGPSGEFTFTQVTSRPSTAARHTQLSIRDGSDSFRLATTFHLADPLREHATTIQWRDVAAGDVVNPAAVAALDLSSTTIDSLRGVGTTTRDQFDLRLTLEAEQVRLAAATARLAGLDGAVWRASLARLPRVQVGLKAAGRWSQPRLSIVPAGALGELKYQLRSAGAHELVEAIESSKGKTTASVDRSPTAAKGTDPAPTPAATFPAAKSAASPLTGPLAAAPATVAGPRTASLPVPAAASSAAPSSSAPARPNFPPFAAADNGLPAPGNRATANFESPAEPSSKPLVAGAGPAGAPPQSPASAPRDAYPATSTPDVFGSMIAGPTGPNTSRSDRTPAEARPSDTLAAGPAPAVKPDAGPRALTESPVSTATRPSAQDAVGRPVVNADGRAPRGGAAPEGRLVTEYGSLPAGAPRSPVSDAVYATDDAGAAPSREPERRAPDVRAPYAASAVARPSAYPSTRPTAVGQPAPARAGGYPSAVSDGPRTPTTAGLRQPTSVLVPSAAPGPLNLQLGSDSLDGQARLPVRNHAAPIKPREMVAPPRIEASQALDPLPEPVKKPLFGSVGGWFGKREKPAAEIEPRRPTRTPEPVDQVDAPESTRPAPAGGNSILRTLFGNNPPSADAPAKPRSRGIFGGSAEPAPSARPTGAAGYATRSEYLTATDDEGAAAARNVPTADYIAPLESRPRAVPAVGGRAIAAGDGRSAADGFEAPQRPERMSAHTPWYDRLIR